MLPARSAFSGETRRMRGSRWIAPSPTRSVRLTSYAALASTPSPPSNGAAAASGSHTVRRGESAWSIARRHGLQPQQLLKRNGLASSAVLKPGMILKLDAAGDK
jgi:membrane-bound lytic murein transglycosylase D